MLDILTIIPRTGPIHIVDVGAMSLGPGTEAYAKLLANGVSRVTGFEPVNAECDKLNAALPTGHRYLPYAIGDGSPRKFYICNYSMTSSLYEPNTPLLECFQGLPEFVRVVQVEDIQTHRLDDLPDLGDIDFLKLDVQGAELDVLLGGEKSVANAVVIQTEVEFVPLYKGQPLFADVDQHLRRAGFSFHGFAGLSGRTFRPVMCNNDPNASLNQVLWADAIYTKDFMAFDKVPTEKLLKLAVILHIQYGSYDLACRALAAVDARQSTNYAQRYMATFIELPIQ
jgi:FkbM family methyltransferase